MKTRALKNYGSSLGLEVYDIDLSSNDEILELGKLIAEQCVVFIDQKITTERLAEIMEQWGSPSRALVHDLICEGKLDGRHWREILYALGLAGVNKSKAISNITYQKDEKNRPRGMFTNGELDWHADQCGIDDAPRMIGLQSVAHSKNSQTTFLCTHDAYESLSSDMRSMVKQLVCRHKWRDGVMAPGLNETQTLLIHYNLVPIDGMETRLYSENAVGTPGIKLPTHSFDGFVGMSLDESMRVYQELRKTIFQEKYVYTQNWSDGQIVFMDQEITLHARPTNILDGNLRQMSRVITYLEKICTTKLPNRVVRLNGKIYTYEEFAQMVDLDRKTKFDQVQSGHYTSFEKIVETVSE